MQALRIKNTSIAILLKKNAQVSFPDQRALNEKLIEFIDLLKTKEARNIFNN